MDGKSMDGKLYRYGQQSGGPWQHIGTGPYTYPSIHKNAGLLSAVVALQMITRSELAVKFGQAAESSEVVGEEGRVRGRLSSLLSQRDCKV